MKIAAAFCLALLALVTLVTPAQANVCNPPYKYISSADMSIGSYKALYIYAWSSQTPCCKIVNGTLNSHHAECVAKPPAPGNKVCPPGSPPSCFSQHSLPQTPGPAPDTAQ